MTASFFSNFSCPSHFSLFATGSLIFFSQKPSMCVFVFFFIILSIYKKKKSFLMKWLQNFQSINVVVKQVYEEEECFFGQSATGSKENNLLLPGEKTEDVYIDPDDTVQFVRTKIETVCKVPVIYQCLFHKGICITHSFDTIIVREDELQLEKKIDIGDSRLVEKTTDFIGNVKTLHLYSLSGWVANNINRLYEMNNDDLDKLYNRFIKIYWPYCDNIKFKELVDGRV